MRQNTLRVVLNSYGENEKSEITFVEKSVYCIMNLRRNQDL